MKELDPEDVDRPPGLRIREVLGWVPAHDDLDHIVRTSLAWERHLLEHPAA